MTQPSLIRITALWVCAALLATGLLGWGGYSIYKYRQRGEAVRLVSEAREDLAKGNYRNASVCVRRALQIDPDSLEACRAAAELAEAMNSNTAIPWRRRVVDLDPHTTRNLLDWANAAVRFGDIKAAREALRRVSESDRNTVGYHESAARLAVKSGELSQAESHYVAALKIDDSNEICRIGLAKTRLQSADRETREQARLVIEELSEKPQFRLEALRVLVADAVRRGDARELSIWAKKLCDQPEATFADRVVYLASLRAIDRRQFAAYLSRVEEEAARDPDNAAHLISWMNANRMALLALDWAGKLSGEILSTPLLTMAMAESHAKLHDWAGLGPLVREGDWNSKDFLRRAYLARWLREEGSVESSRAQWSLALKGAGNDPASLALLNRMLTEWRWDEEVIEVLWKMADQNAERRSALLTLYGRYREARDTAGLLRVSSRLLELEPDNLDVKNNVAMFSLLLNVDMDRAYGLAQEAHAADPSNPAYASTYAFSLHKQGRTKEGLAILGSLPAEARDAPEMAVYFGIMLAAEPGKAGEALEYLDRAVGSKLYREERTLVSRARLALGGQ